MLARFVADPPTVTMQRIKALLTGGARIAHGSHKLQSSLLRSGANFFPLPCMPALSLHSRMQVCQRSLTCRGASQLVRSRRTTWLASSDAEEGAWCVQLFHIILHYLRSACVARV